MARYPECGRAGDPASHRASPHADLRPGILGVEPASYLHVARPSGQPSAVQNRSRRFCRLPTGTLRPRHAKQGRPWPWLSAHGAVRQVQRTIGEASITRFLTRELKLAVTLSPGARGVNRRLPEGAAPGRVRNNEQKSRVSRPMTVSSWGFPFEERNCDGPTKPSPTSSITSGNLPDEAGASRWLSARPARALCQRLDDESAGKPIRTLPGAHRARYTAVPSELFRHLGLLPTHTGNRLVDPKAHPHVLLETVALGAHQGPQSSGVGHE